MQNACTNEVVIKLFTGIPLKPELKLQLQQSKIWQQAMIFGSGEREIIEINYQGRDYIGSFLSQKKPTLADVQQSDARIRRCLSMYCPEFPLTEISVHIFPQVFVG
jgi:hypothetical protein